jgi:hypothetical protein
MDKVYNLNLPQGEGKIFNFQFLMSFIVIMHCVNVLSNLRRTISIGASIIMMMSLRFDLIKFFTAFTLPLIAFVVITLFNSAEFTAQTLNAFDIFLQLFSAFTGEQQFGEFNKYFGQSYIVIFIMVYFILLLNLLIAMFSNTYQRIYENKNAIRLRRILETKNHLSHDPIIGSITSTFFPINIIMLPMMIPVLFVKNKKLNEMINKLQYAGMIVLQTIAITLFQILLFPIMYAKMVLNSFHIMIISKQNKGIERYLEPLFSIIVSPFVIMISIFVDIISLPSVLLRPDFEFELKYQRSVDELNEDQL